MLRFTRSSFFAKYRAFFSTSNKPEKFNVLFFGTDIIAKTVLEALHKNMIHQFKNHLVQNLAVVTSPDIQGKKHQQPVKLFCEEKNIIHYHPLSKNKDNHTTEWDSFVKDTLTTSDPIQPKKFDLGIVCSFGYMIPDQVIDYFPRGMVVLHPSLLPRYRGASPIQYALINGDKETGISIIQITKGKFDAGKILLQEKVPIEPTMRYKELAMELAALGGNRIIDFLENFDYYHSRGFLQSQSEYKKSGAKKFDVEDTYINWKEQTNTEVYNRYRAFYGTAFHTVRTKFGDEWFLIDEMGIVQGEGEEDQLLKNYTKAEPGSIWVVKNKKFKNFLYVKCKEGWVVIRGGYPQNTKPQPSYKFIERYINKDKIFGDNQATGHYFFG